ncbi:MAG: ABC transporter ATP-binding protein [candidate division Zixibacteria bacterium]|nr:ABC transporter ATP-binding protein [candidate division Zixibacteria bacterium]
MHVIEVQELTKIYQTGLKKGNIVALDNVSLAVEQGEIFGLLGPNGAGKTTLLKVLLNITRISSGQALVLGLPPDNPESRRKVGYLPENHRFPIHLTGLGLLEFTGRLYGLSQKEIDSRSENLLVLVGMERWGNTKIRKYSKGMSQRIGLAQALISDPEILLLDEPTDGVDPIGKIEIRKVMEKIRAEGKTIFLNSHLLSEVESVADRVAILTRGKVARVGSVESLTSRQSQYEIKAAIGNEIFDIPEEMGKRLSMATDGMIVELNNEDDINFIIDQLRMRKVKIKSIKPLKISLEQSFFETVTENKEAAQ